MIAIAAHAQVKVTVEKRQDNVYPVFRFRKVPAPKLWDAAATADFSIVDGRIDPHSGGLQSLKDGLTPIKADQPSLNFFFASGSNGGRLRLDFRHVLDMGAIDTYSWHSGERGPQVYTLYASDASDANFNPDPKRPINPTSVGWKLVAKVDTRTSGEMAGAYGVSIQDLTRSIGRYRYLLFDIAPTETSDNIGNTFYSEIDVIEAGKTLADEATPPSIQSFAIEGGKYHFTLDVTETPELAQWARVQLVPVVQQWYPILITMLPSSGFVPPRSFSITFRRNMDGVAVTSDTRISGAGSWYQDHMNHEGVGSIVHEMVHVVQQIRLSPKPPLWLTEGSADYIRFYKYEPETHGANIAPGDIAKARYDDSYRTSANFLNWVASQSDPNLVADLNAAMRQGHYNEKIWRKLTGRSLEELGGEWKQSLTR